MQYTERKKIPKQVKKTKKWKDCSQQVDKKDNLD